MPTRYCAYPDPSCGGDSLRYAANASSGLASSCVATEAEDPCLLQVAAGIEFSCALGRDGSVWCWGENDHGQSGDGTLSGEPRDVPSRVALPADVQAASVGCGEAHACILSRDGRVFCWGGGDSLQLGLGVEDAADHSAPVEVNFPDTAGPIKELSVGAAHNCAVDSKEAIWCWGENNHEESGQSLDSPCAGSNEAVGSCDEVPVPTVVAAGAFAADHVVSGDEFTCAIDDLNELWCWGDNSLAELGLGTLDVTGGSSSRQTPVPQATGRGSFLTLDTATDMLSVATGDEHACALVGGSVLCWGGNGSGQVGIGSTTVSEATPLFVESARNIEIGCTAKHTCTINGADLRLTCWGNNTDGQVGAGNIEPVLAPTATPLVAVRDAALGDRHTCALTAGGGLYCWGANDKGQLGLPVSAAVSTPTLSAAAATICR